MKMTVTEAKTRLEHVACFSVNEKTGICHIEYSDRPECYKPLCKCVDLVLAIDILHRFAIDEYNRLCHPVTW